MTNKNNAATFTARILTEENGTYEASHDILADIMDGQTEFDGIDDLLWALSEQGYTETMTDFHGWGTVLRHNEDGSLIAVEED